MIDFTALLNRGHKLYIAKNPKPPKKRKFGKCDDCEKTTLLLEYHAPDDDLGMNLCEQCYISFLDGEGRSK